MTYIEPGAEQHHLTKACIERSADFVVDVPGAEANSEVEEGVLSESVNAFSRMLPGRHEYLRVGAEKRRSPTGRSASAARTHAMAYGVSETVNISGSTRDARVTHDGTLALA